MADYLSKSSSSTGLIPFAGEFDQLLNRMVRSWPFGWLDTMGAAQIPALRAFEPAPKVEVKENGSAYTVCVEVPGLDQNDVKVFVEDGTLTVSGEKKIERHDEKTHYSERSYGSFTRSFRLPPDADPERISAGYAKGLLTLEIAKAANGAARAKEIEIRPSSD